MSGFLDQKLAALKISSDGQQSPKKVGPAVPPKPKKPQPQVSEAFKLFCDSLVSSHFSLSLYFYQVPKSYALNGPSEPSFTSPLHTTSPEKKTNVYMSPVNQHTGNIYSNIPSGKCNLILVLMLFNNLFIYNLLFGDLF